MKNIKGLKELKDMLTTFEQGIIERVQWELIRINRTVAMDEFSFIPFNEDVQDYIDAIRLDEDKNPVLETSFHDTTEKSLSNFISDNEIDHWNMIALLELLIDTPDFQTTNLKTL